MIFQACLRAAVVAVCTGEQLKGESYRNTNELLRCIVEVAAPKKEGALLHSFTAQADHQRLQERN